MSDDVTVSPCAVSPAFPHGVVEGSLPAYSPAPASRGGQTLDLNTPTPIQAEQVRAPIAPPQEPLDVWGRVQVHPMWSAHYSEMQSPVLG